MESAAGSIGATRAVIGKTPCKQQRQRGSFGVIGWVLLALLAAAPFVATAAQRVDLLGEPAPTSAGRLVHLDAGTRYVNVEGGETVCFERDGKRFSWNFSGPLMVSSFKLTQVAPPGFLDHEVTVYIAPNPLYRGPA